MTSPSPGIQIAALDGEPVLPSVHLHVDAATFADGPVPPDVDADDLEAARLQTLLVLVEEAILAREPGHDHLVLVDGGVRAVRAEDVPA